MVPSYYSTLPDCSKDKQVKMSAQQVILERAQHVDQPIRVEQVQHTLEVLQINNAGSPNQEPQETSLYERQSTAQVFSSQVIFWKCLRTPSLFVGLAKERPNALRFLYAASYFPEMIHPLNESFLNVSRALTVDMANKAAEDMFAKHKDEYSTIRQLMVVHEARVQYLTRHPLVPETLESQTKLRQFDFTGLPTELQLKVLEYVGANTDGEKRIFNDEDPNTDVWADCLLEMYNKLDRERDIMALALTSKTMKELVEWAYNSEERMYLKQGARLDIEQLRVDELEMMRLDEDFVFKEEEDQESEFGDEEEMIFEDFEDFQDFQDNEMYLLEEDEITEEML